MQGPGYLAPNLRWAQTLSSSPLLTVPILALAGARRSRPGLIGSLRVAALAWVLGLCIPEPHFSAPPRQYAASAAGIATHPHGAAGFSTCAQAALLQAVPSSSMLLWRLETTTSTFTASGICSSLAVWGSCCPLVPRLTTGSHLEPGPGDVVTSCASMSRKSWVLWVQEEPLSAASVPAERGFGHGPWRT